MYETPLNIIYSDIANEIQKYTEENMMLKIRQAIGYDIDKEELIRAMCYDRNQYEKGFKDGMEQKAKWVPVRERLPEERGLYLVSMNRWGYPQRAIDGFIYGKWERFGNDVLAWMPLPEPYKEVEDENNS